MPAILDLVETGFGDELDPQGWKMLHQMRKIYQPNPIARTIYGTIADTDGFVCQNGDALVGNLSLRVAYPRTTHGRLIGNVVVDPDHRGQGIGRTLVEYAIQAAREEHATWVGLEVRADNEIASHLYEHLGFRAVGTTVHMLRPKDLKWPELEVLAPGWRRFTSPDGDRWKELAARIHGHDQQLVLEVRREPFSFRSFEGWLNRVLARQVEDARVRPGRDTEIDMAVHTMADRKYRFHAWDILMGPDLGTDGAREVVAQCIALVHRLPPWPVVTIVADQPLLIEQLRAIGFEIHRTLQQMILWL